MSSVDVKGTVEIKRPRFKFAALSLLGLGLVAVGTWARASGGGTVRLTDLTVLIGLGALTLILFIHLFQNGGVVITLSPDGIRDVRLSSSTIPWRDIEAIGTWTFAGSGCVVLKLHQQAKQRLAIKPLGRIDQTVTAFLGANGYSISPRGLETDFDELLGLIVRYAAAHRGP